MWSFTFNKSNDVQQKFEGEIIHKSSRFRGLAPVRFKPSLFAAYVSIWYQPIPRNIPEERKPQFQNVYVKGKGKAAPLQAWTGQ